MSIETDKGACRESLERFFGQHPDATTHCRALRVLRMLTACQRPFRGKPEGWAAGIIYGLANRHRRACGLPGLLNSEAEALFGVSMGTIRRRAAQIERLLAL
ncbi:MAG: hypothetical protein HZB38_19195 [Planctomycetes bacterium]|nr:hypothetical protein [Planctomycetota bacterium]